MESVLITLCVILVAYFAYIYNKLTRQRNLVAEAWSGIEVQLKRRSDLIPNLVELVKGYGKHERETFENVISLRARSEAANEPAEKEKIEKDVARGIKTVLALVEDYPELKADKNFRELQSTLTEVEDNIQYARRYYNGTVRDMNILVQSFPSNLIARQFGFSEKPFFEIEYATERKTPDIDF
ncbi:MAG: LemA family protein [Candidatus Dadabacteria bacterium]|nr:MAG: LemA family protein [Candidatus Dadabacteria bacterium]